MTETSSYIKSVVQSILSDNLEVTSATFHEYLNKRSSGCTQAVVMDFRINGGMRLTISDDKCFLKGNKPGTIVEIGPHWFLLNNDVYVVTYAGGMGDSYGFNIAICRHIDFNSLELLKKHYNKI